MEKIHYKKKKKKKITVQKRRSISHKESIFHNSLEPPTQRKRATTSDNFFLNLVILCHCLASQEPFSIKWQQVSKTCLNNNNIKKLVQKCYETKIRVQM